MGANALRRAAFGSRAVTFVILLSIVSVLVLSSGTTAVSRADVLITDHRYVRHDGGRDRTITSCGSDATTPGPGGDDGGNRQANEPAVAINPRNPDIMVAGSNDYCGVETFGDAWMGFYVSMDRGMTWKNSLNPGYPTDTSDEGRASPIFRRAFSSGDPILDWDNGGRLFYGGIAFNRVEPNPSEIVTPTNGDVIVSTWETAPSAPLGMDYLRTVIVGEGTPSAFFFGRFNDKPSLRVDDWRGSPHEGNVYISWTLFPGLGQDQILFSRSTDQGRTFSAPIKISTRVASAQGSDIAVAPNGDVYVVWREFNQAAAGVDNSIVFVKSTDGGQSFGDPQAIRDIVPYDRRDTYVSGGGARDCGDGPFLCVSKFVFHRTGSLPQAVADRDGNVYVTWEELIPAADNGDTYRPDGQSTIVVTKSTNGGATWSDPKRPDAQAKGHQWWPNIEYDRSVGKLHLIYYDSREDASYSVNRPPGNLADGTNVCGVPASRTCNVLNTFIASSGDGGATWTATKVSRVGHQPEYEMFGNRDVPFHGDYLWIDANGGVVFGVWTDNRDVVAGKDIREATQDGFDVLQCRAVDPDTGAVGSDTCPNAGGLNQNIYGARLG